MTVTTPPAVRLRIDEMRHDDKAMRPAPWDCVPLIVRLHRDDQPRGSESYGIARSRNQLASTATMLEALLVERDAWRRKAEVALRLFGGSELDNVERLTSAFEALQSMPAETPLGKALAIVLATGKDDDPAVR